MIDPLLLQLVKLAEGFDGSKRLEIPITIQIGGSRVSGMLISSRNFIQLIRNSPIQSQLQEVAGLQEVGSIELPQDAANYLHILGCDGGDPATTCWRFSLDAVDGFTLGGLRSSAQTEG